MGIGLSETAWRLYVAPKGRIGNHLQGAALKVIETQRVKRLIRNSGQLVLVHSPGKVGSSAIYQSLVDSALSNNAVIFQTHTIRSPSDPRTIAERHGLSPRRTDYTSEYLHKLVADGSLFGWEVKLISAVRDPIQRLISDFFQNLDRYTPDKKYPRDGQYSVEEYLEFFLGGVDLFRHSDWYEEQFRDLFGLDLYGTPFDKNTGFQIVKSPRMTAGVVRYDLMNEAAPRLFEIMFNHRLNLSRANDSSDKVYADAYRAFKKDLKFDEATLNRIYSLEHVQHFFSEGERLAAIEKWRQ